MEYRIIGMVIGILEFIILHALLPNKWFICVQFLIVAILMFLSILV